jgi:hypothetical protein
MILIKNTTQEQKTWCGQEIAAQSSYQIEESKKIIWANDAQFISDLFSGYAVVNDGFSDLSFGEAINLLKSLGEFNRDQEQNPIFKSIIALRDMVFKPRCFDFVTGKYLSLCNISSDGSQLNDATISFFDASFTAIEKTELELDEEYQARLDSSCVHTWLIFTPSVKYAIKSGEIRYKGTISSEADAWVEVVPHIPKAYGGSVPFIDGGLPLDFYKEKESIIIDGINCAVIDIDETYLSHRLGVKISHSAGDKIGILATFNKYQ